MPGPAIGFDYRAEDRDRRAPETHKAPGRPAFTRDRARVLHSWALRRLADKTQVLLPGESDFPRTRLTHTLEVAQIARETGAALGCDPDLVETAGLCHDLGHPPFGHNGEAALDRVAAGIGGFEGNAQSFRVLTRLESKVFVDGAPFGLNLTRASLDAMIKYPWPRPSQGGKFNVYDDDLPAFRWVRADAEPGRTCLEAQVMDWADDVAYSVHDIEDALYSGYLTPHDLGDGVRADEVMAVAQADYGMRLDHAGLMTAFERLRALPFWPVEFTGSARSLAGLKAMTSGLIGRFSQAAVVATRAEFGDAPLGRYGASLVVPAEALAEVAVLKSLSSLYVFHRAGVADAYAAQRELLAELCAALYRGGSEVLARAFQADWATAPDADGRLRVVVDQVASMTDVSAVRWHARLCSRPT